MSVLAPFGSVLDDPLGQCSLKPEVASELLGLNPLVLASPDWARLRFAVGRGVLRQIIDQMGLFSFVKHNHN